MSSLEKLAFRGIRSFDNQDLAVMKFYSPLTVIVGTNGSGKTTIIECLKYATTGDLPPNTKGGAFVHDPAIAGTSEVKASVKLRFFNIKKEKMMVERRLQVSKKKTGTGLTMKTLEGVITYADENVDASKRQTLSTKCAALDEEVPKQLGVSKAILENVIFCHQEESNWPLSEPASLKKKFDDIFEATKYTKALDAIKVLRKDQAVEIRVNKEKLLALKTDRDRSIKLKDTQARLTKVIEQKSSEHENLDLKIREMIRKNQEFYERATMHTEIINRAETLETQRRILEENLAQLKSSFRELKDLSEQALAESLSNFETNLETVRRGRAEAGRKLGEESDALAAAERKRTMAYGQQGNLLAKEERYEKTLQERQILTQSLSRAHNIPGYEHELSNEEIREFCDKLDELVRVQTGKIETIKREAQKVDRECRDAIQSLKSEQAADQQAQISVFDQIRILNLRLTKQTDRLTETAVNEGDVVYEEANLAGERQRKIDAEETYQRGDFPALVTRGESELRRLEDVREKYLEELNGLNKQADTRARLGLKKADLARKEESIQSLIDKDTAAYVKFVKAQPVRDVMEEKVNAVVIEYELELENAEARSNTAARALQTLESSITVNKSKVRALQLSADGHRARISEGLRSCDSECATPSEGLVDAEAELDMARNEVSNIKGSADFFKRVLNQGKKNSLCVGCNRGLSGVELKQFEKHCAREIDRQPEKAKAAQDEQAGWEAEVAKLKALLPAEVALKQITDVEIPDAVKAARALDDKLPELTSAADTAATRTRELKDQLRDLQLLKRTATDVMRMFRECTDLTRGIAALESELFESGTIETADEVQTRLTNVANEIKIIKITIEQARNQMLSHRRASEKITNSIHTLELVVNAKKQALKDKLALEKSMAEARVELAALEASKATLAVKLAGYKAPIRKLEMEAAQAAEEFKVAEQTASAQLSLVAKSVHALEDNSSEIRKFTTENTARKLVDCETEIERYEAIVADVKTCIVELQQQVSTADKQESESKSELRNIRDNLRFRKENAEVQRILAQIAELRVDDARRAARRFNADYDIARKQLVVEQASQAQLSGEIKTMTADLAEKVKEQMTEYKDIEVKYKTELLRDKMTQVANEDLEKYSKALDSAIMKFHSHKMEEINSTLKELWQKTYQGTDIDGISIRTDTEAKGVGGRSYNYRVVMAKDNVEMDMRGRCSAGQKVLASIIIRLALAESFSTNCGILALDEPTTNLDKENIHALSQSLADIIRERRGQANFQLIVITHDEDFLTTLGAQGVLDAYLRVSRSADGKTSKILRQTLS